MRTLPARFDIAGNRAVGAILVVFAIVFGAESVLLVISALQATDFPQTILGTQHMVLAPVGVLFLVWGINQLFVDGELIADRLEVTCRYRNLAGRHAWSEPIHSYRGVRKQRTTAGSRFVGGQQALFCIWLVHGRRSRSLRLYQSWSSECWDEELRYYADLFRMPILDG